jgi:integrase
LEDTPKNRKDLKKLIEQMEAEITLGSFDYKKYFPRSKRAEGMSSRANRVAVARKGIPTFGGFSKLWTAEKEIEWKDSYKRKVSTLVNNYLLPRFESVLIDQITKADLLDFRTSLAKVKYGKNQASLTASRINQIMTPLRMLLQEAADRYDFESPYKNINNLNETKPFVEPFTMDEVKIFLDAVRPDFRAYYTVRFFTGLRTSEIDGLRWHNVDFNRREIDIREALVVGQIVRTKTPGSVRAVRMSAVVYQALIEHKERVQGRSEFVFSSRDGGPVDYRNINKRIWRPTLKLLNIKLRRAYQTRHTAATLWLAAGENPEWIARQLGHSNTEMLFRVYSRYIPDLTRKDGSAIDALIQSNKIVEVEHD